MFSARTHNWDSVTGIEKNLEAVSDWGTATWHLIGDDLHATELGKGVKVRFTGKSSERMLQHKGCGPHLVRRDWGALLTQLLVNSCVVMRRPLVGIEC
jgi:hypothetical protein